MTDVCAVPVVLYSLDITITIVFTVVVVVVIVVVVVVVVVVGGPRVIGHECFRSSSREPPPSATNARVWNR